MQDKSSWIFDAHGVVKFRGAKTCCSVRLFQICYIIYTMVINVEEIVNHTP